ncbi:unnamed protein product [Rhizoctonia solani]|uniref:Laminin domain protein n=1 Tax=Rhizoctonia solani TaxID=456999 RepID=A0A8H2WEW4_9AGAM|nr:unnamed protein product [Rhizoctonia solani]
MGDPTLLSRLSEHLFDAQMARYRSKYLVTTFPESTIYTPPTLPAHVPIQLEPITGAPSEEELIKVQEAIRLYYQFSNVPSMFDPHMNMELSQHFFDVQMARHVQRAQQGGIPFYQEISSTNPARPAKRTTSPIEEPNANTNNAGTGAGINEPTQPVDTGVKDAIERSNRLAEQANELCQRANLLIERSNQIAERSNQLVDQSIRPVDQSDKPTERFNQLLERLDEQLKQSNRLAEKSTKPLEKLGDMLWNINRVLVRIQHAIVRSHKGNTVRALDCLVNEKGETPLSSDVTGAWTFADFTTGHLPVVIDGVSRDAFIPDHRLGNFLRFHGICRSLFKDASSTELRPGNEVAARERLSEYLTSCLG